VWLERFSENGLSLVSVTYGMIGYFIGLLLALAFYTVALWPLQLIRRPGWTIEEHPMDTLDPDTTID
jgi:hypothetical protein